MMQAAFDGKNTPHNWVMWVS